MLSTSSDSHNYHKTETLKKLTTDCSPKTGEGPLGGGGVAIALVAHMFMSSTNNTALRPPDALYLTTITRLKH